MLSMVWQSEKERRFVNMVETLDQKVRPQIQYDGGCLGKSRRE